MTKEDRMNRVTACMKRIIEVVEECEVESWAHVDITRLVQIIGIDVSEMLGTDDV